MPILRPSVQSLLIEMRFNGVLLSTGTAFVADTPKGPHLITNRHNFTGRHQDTDKPLSDTGGIPNEIVIWHNCEPSFSWKPIFASILDGENPRWREHPTLGPKADIVALPLAGLEGVVLHPYDLYKVVNDFQYGPGDAVSVIGFPFGIPAGGRFGVWATGFLASEPEVDFDGLPVLLVDCRTRQGQSGSPVLAYRGYGSTTQMKNGSLIGGPTWRFVGIYSGRINKESDLGKVWKLSAIRELVESL